MDLLSLSSMASDGSVDDDSTSPTTPASSPRFNTSRADYLAVNSLSDLLSSSMDPSRVDMDAASESSGMAPSEASPAFKSVKNVCVIGGGYVGGPTAAVLAFYNPSVAVEVLDRDQSRIQRWKSSHLPVHEPGLKEVVRVVRDGAEIDGLDASETGKIKRRPNLFFTSDSASSISKADVIFLAVNTPTKTFGVGAGRATNMTAVDGAVEALAMHAKPGAIIVEKSTVPCGTAQRIREALAVLRPGVPFEVLSNPEFLAEGSAIQNLTNPDRVLIGSLGTLSGRHAARALATLYTSWVPASRILEINAWSSELAKLVANAMLAQRISSINSISAICERTGADVDQVAKAIGLDARIGGKFLKAGLGFGGSCFRKDIASLTYLAESLGLDEVAQYWKQVNAMNEFQRDRFARKVIDRFNGNLAGRKLAMLGFAFKKNTGDSRESLAVDVIRLLAEERPAEIAIFDPLCREEDIMRELVPVCGVFERSFVKVHTDAYSACSQAHAVMIVNDCDQFRNNLVKRSRPTLSATKKMPETKISHEICMPTVGLLDHGALDCEGAAITETWVANGSMYLLNPEEACPNNCSDCRSQSSRSIASEPVEWPRIAYNMKEPKYVFDGRGLLNARQMERLGFRVEAVGKKSS